MARYKFGGTNADGVFSVSVVDTRHLLTLASASLTFWDAETGGSQYTDLLDAEGASVSSVVTGLGQVPVFWGPDGVSELWADDGDGTRALMAGRIQVPTTAADVGALPDTTVIPSTAADVGAEPAGLSQATSDTLAATFGRKADVPTTPDFRQIPVVMLHQFTDSIAAEGTVKNYLAWGYTPIFYSEAMEYLRTGDDTNMPAKPIVLTVDDGGASGYTYLFPQLQAYNVKATFFVVPDWLDGTISAPANGGSFLEASALTWTQAREMFASGLCEFQSHTKNHGSMRAMTGAGTYTADLSDDGTGAGADFLYVKDRIETEIPGAVVEYGACPYGVINEAAITALAAAGCKGHRITTTGKDTKGVYDGSGPFAFLTATTDPFRVPIASAGAVADLKRFELFGEVERDGNQIENGRFLVTSRGFTFPTGWSYFTTTLPQDEGEGPCARGLGANASAALVHTDLIPVGLYTPFNLDWWLWATGLAPSGDAKVSVQGYRNPTDATPTRTLYNSTTSDTSGWARKRWYVPGYSDVAWVKVAFYVPGADADTDVRLWDIKLRRTRTAFPSGL